MLLGPPCLLANPAAALAAALVVGPPMLASTADCQNVVNLFRRPARASRLQIACDGPCEICCHLAEAWQGIQIRDVLFIISPHFVRERSRIRELFDHPLPKREKVPMPARLEILAHRGSLRHAATKDVHLPPHFGNLRRPKRESIFDFIEFFGIHVLSHVNAIAILARWRFIGRAAAAKGAIIVMSAHMPVLAWAAAFRCAAPFPVAILAPLALTAVAILWQIHSFNVGHISSCS